MYIPGKQNAIANHTIMYSDVILAMCPTLISTDLKLEVYCNNVPNAELQRSKCSSDWQQFWAQDSIPLTCIQLV